MILLYLCLSTQYLLVPSDQQGGGPFLTRDFRTFCGPLLLSPHHRTCLAVSEPTLEAWPLTDLEHKFIHVHVHSGKYLVYRHYSQYDNEVFLVLHHTY